MARITLYQERSSLSVDGYRVLNRLDAVDGIPLELFVFTTATEEFSHVASLEDFFWPTVKDTARPFYRKSEASRTFQDVHTALTFASYTKERLMKLVDIFDAEVLDFAGHDTLVYPAV